MTGCGFPRCIPHFPHGMATGWPAPGQQCTHLSSQLGLVGKVGKLENALGRKIRQFIGDYIGWLAYIGFKRDPDIGIIWVGWVIIIRDDHEPTS